MNDEEQEAKKLLGELRNNLTIFSAQNAAIIVTGVALTNLTNMDIPWDEAIVMTFLGALMAQITAKVVRSFLA